MKFLKLCQNEVIKTMKKKSTKLMIILTLVSILGALGFSYLIKVLNDFTSETILYVSNNEETINHLENELKDNSLSEREKGYVQAQLDMYNLANENNVNLNNIMYNYWKVELLNVITQEKVNVVDLKLQQANNTEIEEKESLINELISIIKEDNYNKYIDIQKQQEKESLDKKQITEKQYNLNIEILDLMQKYEINKTGTMEDSWKTSLLDEIRILKNNLLTGIDSNSGKVLTVEKQQEQEDVIKLDLYKLENNIPTMDSLTDYRMYYDYSIYINIFKYNDDNDNRFSNINRNIKRYY